MKILKQIRWSKSNFIVNNILIFTFMYFSATAGSYGQILDSSSGTIKQNAVKIRSIFLDNSEYTAFGFIFSEDEDSLNIVTVFDAVKSISYSTITRGEVQFFNGLAVPVIDIMGFFPNYKLAMLKVEKPKDFQWDEKFISTKVVKDETVWILGRDGEWNEPTQEYMGKISESSYSKIKVNISGNRSGMIGASVVKNGRIVGMVTNDQGDRLSVLPIERIKFYAYKWLDIKVKDHALTTPYFIVGGSLGVLYPMSKDMGRLKIFTPDFGFFVEAGLFSSFSIRVENNFNKFISNTYTVSGQSLQFRHRFPSFTIKLQVRESSDFETQQNKTIFLGYSNMNINPALSINGGEWTSLKDLDDFKFDYPDKSHYLFVGGGSNKIFFNKLVIGLEVGLGYSNGKYLLLNILKPFEENKHNDWLMYIRINTGFIFGNKMPKFRFLR